MGQHRASPSPTNARAAIASKSSDPFPAITWETSKPYVRAACRLSRVEPGSGYRRSEASASARMARLTKGEGGYGFSFVLSLRNLRSWGCSPGTYPAILAMFLRNGIFIGSLPGFVWENDGHGRGGG